MSSSTNIWVSLSSTNLERYCVITVVWRRRFFRLLPGEGRIALNKYARLVNHVPYTERYCGIV